MRRRGEGGAVDEFGKREGTATGREKKGRMEEKKMGDERSHRASTRISAAGNRRYDNGG